MLTGTWSYTIRRKLTKMYFHHTETEGCVG